MLLNSPCQYLSKRHTQLSGQYAPKVTLGLWVCCFFICFCFCFKVMFLSPFNGEYATWLIMCFQTCRFSDNSWGATVVPQRLAERWLPLKRPQVKNLNGWPWQRGPWFAACHLWNKRSSGGSLRGKGEVDGDVSYSNAVHFTACHWACVWMT